jgi:serine/threonine protein kinase
VALTPLRADDPAEVAGYRLLGRLGAGGMGVVYLGEAPGPEGGPAREVAVKVVRGELADDDGFRARFRREVTAARRVSGACVVEVLDADPEADTPYMVSEYVRGPDLGSLVAQYGPLDGRRQHAFAAGLAQALLSIHSVGLVHRDLKPANVLCAQRGLKVIDFGIASAADGASLTRTGLVVGTTGWMSPEQVNGEKVLPLTDIFCWASVIYFAATGLAPFGEGSPATVLYRVVANDPDLSHPLIEPRLRPLMAAAFRKDARSRPAAPDLLDYLLPKRSHRPGVNPDDAPAFRHQAFGPTPAAPTALTPPPHTTPPPTGRPEPQTAVTPLPYGQQQRHDVPPPQSTPLPQHPSGPQPAPVFAPTHGYPATPPPGGPTPGYGPGSPPGQAYAPPPAYRPSAPPAQPPPAQPPPPPPPKPSRFRRRKKG